MYVVEQFAQFAVDYRAAAMHPEVVHHAKRAVIDPYVDFTSLDVVGVVVDKDTQGDRLVVNGNAGGR